MMKKWMLMVLMVLSCIGVCYADVDAKQAGKDWLKADEFLDSQSNFLSQSEFEKSPDEFIELWSTFRDDFGEFKTEFMDRYGSDRQSINASLENVKKPLDSKRDMYSLSNELTAVDLTGMHATIVGWAEDIGRDRFRSWKSMENAAPEKIELKLRRARDALKFFTYARTLNPDGDYGEFIDQAEDAVKSTEPEYKKILDKLEWPGHNSDFEGPGNPGKLAAAALEFLRKNPDWSKPEYPDKHTPYAACVEGKRWEIWKRAPLTQEPTQYSLDMLVAFTGEKDDEIAYVYHMVFYTEEAGGVKKELPFRFANSRQYAKFTMLLDKIPEGGSSGSGSSGGGMLGTVWRLLLSLALIAGGAVCARSVVLGKVPQLKGLIRIFNSQAVILGLALIALGGLAFLGNLLRLSPLASILPQLTAVMIGLVLWKKTVPAGSAPLQPVHAPETVPARDPGDSESSEPQDDDGDTPASEETYETGTDDSEKDAGERLADAGLKAAEKAGEFVDRHQDKIEALAARQTPLGILAIVFGFLHLILGGYWLL